MNATTMALMCIGVRPIPHPIHEQALPYEQRGGSLSYNDRRRAEKERRRAEILEFMKRTGRPVKLAEIGKAFGMSETVSGTYVAQLRDQGAVTTSRRRQTWFYEVAKK